MRNLQADSGIAPPGKAHRRSNPAKPATRSRGVDAAEPYAAPDRAGSGCSLSPMWTKSVVSAYIRDDEVNSAD